MTCSCGGNCSSQRGTFRVVHKALKKGGLPLKINPKRKAVFKNGEVVVVGTSEEDEEELHGDCKCSKSDDACGCHDDEDDAAAIVGTLVEAHGSDAVGKMLRKAREDETLQDTLEELQDALEGGHEEEAMEHYRRLGDYIEQSPPAGGTLEDRQMAEPDDYAPEPEQGTTRVEPDEDEHEEKGTLEDTETVPDEDDDSLEKQLDIILGNDPRSKLEKTLDGVLKDFVRRDEDTASIPPRDSVEVGFSHAYPQDPDNNPIKVTPSEESTSEPPRGDATEYSHPAGSDRMEDATETPVDDDPTEGPSGFGQTEAEHEGDLQRDGPPHKRKALADRLDAILKEDEEPEAEEDDEPEEVETKQDAASSDPGHSDDVSQAVEDLREAEQEAMENLSEAEENLSEAIVDSEQEEMEEAQDRLDDAMSDEDWSAVADEAGRVSEHAQHADAHDMKSKLKSLTDAILKEDDEDEDDEEDAEEKSLPQPDASGGVGGGDAVTHLQGVRDGMQAVKSMGLKENEHLVVKPGNIIEKTSSPQSTAAPGWRMDAWERFETDFGAIGAFNKETGERLVGGEAAQVLEFVGKQNPDPIQTARTQQAIAQHEEGELPSGAYEIKECPEHPDEECPEDCGYEAKTGEWQPFVTEAGREGVYHVETGERRYGEDAQRILGEEEVIQKPDPILGPEEEEGEEEPPDMDDVLEKVSPSPTGLHGRKFERARSAALKAMTDHVPGWAKSREHAAHITALAVTEGDFVGGCAACHDVRMKYEDPESYLYVVKQAANPSSTIVEDGLLVGVDHHRFRKERKQLTELVQRAHHA